MWEIFEGENVTQLSCRAVGGPCCVHGEVNDRRSPPTSMYSKVVNCTHSRAVEFRPEIQTISCSGAPISEVGVNFW